MENKKSWKKIMSQLSPSLTYVYQRKNYEIGKKGRYTRNILEWEQNRRKSRKMTNGDYKVTINLYLNQNQNLSGQA